MTKIFEREEIRITKHETDSCVDCDYFDDEHTSCKHYKSQMKTGYPAPIPTDVLIPAWCPLPESEVIHD
jgi:hypothetical protein